MQEAIKKEIITEKDFLEGESLATIYFGGGTPSVLAPEDIALLLETIRQNYSVDINPEITLEANPDDLTTDYLTALKNHGINRLSIGVQSFHDEDLVLMNRKHNSMQAIACVELAVNAGIDNFSLDLIYGMPEMSNDKWEKNLEIAMNLNPPHLAAYHLSYEPGTVLDYLRKKKKITPVNENKSLDHYNILTELMENKGYEHYEISNFALPGAISKHNSAYWKGEKYLGVGPSAHSYNGQSRRWNISKNTSYIRGIMNEQKVYDEEILDEVSHLHDYLLTSLRTMWGADLLYLKHKWGAEYYDHVLQKAQSYIQTGKVLNIEGKLMLTSEGMFIADHIISELFL